MPESTQTSQGGTDGQSTSASAAGGASQTSGQTTGQTQAQIDAAAAAARTAATTTTVATRPEGVPDAFWDKDKGELKVKELAGEYETLRQFKAADDARKALVPAAPDAYKAELPKDFQLPEKWEINANDPLWKAGREFAHANGLTQEQFSKLASVWVGKQIADQAAIGEAVKARDTALGANGAQRVDALNKWFVAASNETVAKQLSQTLFTPDIIAFWEGVKAKVGNQGVVSFNGAGRESQGRTDGRPENWDSMSALDKRTFDLQNSRKSA